VAVKKWLRLPQDIRRNPAYTLTIMVSISTHNEAGDIEEKLDDVYKRDHPRDKLEVRGLRLHRRHCRKNKYEKSKQLRHHSLNIFNKLFEL